MTIAATTLFLWLCGCAVIPSYPHRLPPLAPAEAKLGVCPVIAGRYADKGAAFSKKGQYLGQVSLTRLLHQYDPPPGPRITNADLAVVIGPENGLLEVQSWSDDKLLATMQRRDRYPIGAPDTYLGNKGFVCLALHAEHGSAAGIGGYASDESLWLRKAVDGSLIVLHRDVGFGILVLAPVWGSNNKWYQFPPVARIPVGAISAPGETKAP